MLRAPQNNIALITALSFGIITIFCRFRSLAKCAIRAKQNNTLQIDNRSEVIA